MRQLLPLFPHPSHYLGTEINAVHKVPGRETLRLALAFPDLYQIGMSYVGQKVLYSVINSRNDMWAERVFAPEPEVASILKRRGMPLTTMESDTPLQDMDIIAFSLTQDLCYTTVLYMLDLAGLPLWAAQRQGYPLVIAGGGNTANAAPVAPFFDALVIGDGEEVIVEIGKLVLQARLNANARETILSRLAEVPGIEVPGSGQDQVERRVVLDLDKVPFPTRPVVPFGKTVHDRLAVEIARGCTRGCRFCHPGMVYRPVRERSLPVLQRLIGQGLDSTGFEELSFLSLSTGDFSMLETLFTQSFSRCLNEQVAVALPSLRVGSVSEQMMELIARIRRTGATLAPEAGSQRLRDVINKGISEEDLLRHTGQLFAHGWKSVKLYFMIGLPTETEDDLEAIFDLCRKVRQSAGAKSRQVQITAAISPFVPKPHTPFQWERQLSLAETRERILCLRDLFKRHKGYRLNWRKPEMSLLEGVFSRGDQSLAKCIERAYQAGDILTSWYEYFDWSLWSKVFAEFGLEPEAYLQGRDEGASLPWGHIKTGVSKGFLSRERTKALEGRASPDCRYGPCLVCGVCNLKGQASTLDSQAQDKDIRPRINQGAREAVLPGQRWTEKDLQTKAQHLRVWYTKLGLARFFSQLELQRIFGRALRRAGLALSFSGGFHPLPRISFGPALPVGVQSLQEWFDVFLRESVQPSQVLERLGPEFPQGLGLSRVQVLDLGKRQPQAIFEEFALEFFGSSSQVDTWRQGLLTALDRSRIVWERPTKAGNKKSEDVRPYFAAAKEMDQNRIWLRFDWQTGYRSPLKLVCLLLPGLTADQFMLTKLRQIMDCQDQRHEVACP